LEPCNQRFDIVAGKDGLVTETTLMSPRGGVNRRDDQIKLFPQSTWADSAPPVRPVVVTGQTGQALVLTDDTGQTGAPHRSDRCSTENLQKQLQAPLGF
jgi:hypothetical protein